MLLDWMLKTRHDLKELIASIVLTTAGWGMVSLLYWLNFSQMEVGSGRSQNFFTLNNWLIYGLTTVLSILTFYTLFRVWFWFYPRKK